MLVISHSSCGHLSSTFQLRFGDSDLGLISPRRPGRPQRAKRDRRDRHRFGARDPGRSDSRGACEVCGSRPAVPAARTVKEASRSSTTTANPTEIRATLAAAAIAVSIVFTRSSSPPVHAYDALMDDFARYSTAQNVYLLDIYAASRSLLDGVSSRRRWRKKMRRVRAPLG